MPKASKAPISALQITKSLIEEGRLETVEERLLALQSLREAQRDQMRFDHSYRTFGLAFAFASELVIVGGTIYLTLHGYKLQAGILGTGGIATIVGKFIQGRDADKN